MKKIIKIFFTIVLFSLPLFTIKKEKTTLPVSTYAKWNGENIVVSDIWFNLPKDRRLAIIDSIYKSKNLKQ